MAKFVRVGEKLINLDNIDYADISPDAERDIVIHFTGDTRTLTIGGDDVEELKAYLTTEQAFQRGFLG